MDTSVFFSSTFLDPLRQYITSSLVECQISYQTCDNHNMYITCRFQNTLYGWFGQTPIPVQLGLLPWWVVVILLILRAQLFEGRLALNPGLNITRVSFSGLQKHFLGQFSVLFLALPIINLQTKRIKTEMVSKLSNLNSHLALTLGYLSPALNNSALLFIFCLLPF